MRVPRSSVFWSVVLVVAGGLLLLGRLDVLATDFIWPAIFGAAGLVFLYVFFTNRDVWWAAIPADALLGLAAVTAWDQLGPPSLAEVGAALYLAAIGAGFVAIYLAGRERWWALIPGGALLTLAAAVGLSTTSVEGAVVAVVLFVGLALTFALAALLSAEESNRLESQGDRT